MPVMDVVRVGIEQWEGALTASAAIGGRSCSLVFEFGSASFGASSFQRRDAHIGHTEMLQRKYELFEFPRPEVVVKRRRIDSRTLGVFAQARLNLPKEIVWIRREMGLIVEIIDAKVEICVQ
jgi:hypothetical protein